MQRRDFLRHRFGNNGTAAQAIFKGMSRVFLWRHVLQIFEPIVRLDAVLMINFHSVRWPNKRRHHHPVNPSTSLCFSAAMLNRTVGIAASIERLSQESAGMHSTGNPAKIRNAVVWKVWNFSPQFDIVHISHRSLLEGNLG